MDHPVSKHSPALEILMHIEDPPPRELLHHVFLKLTKGRKFQACWFHMLTWECIKTSGGITCCICKRHHHMLPSKEVMVTRKHDAFSTVGYTFNNHCLEKLRGHDKSNGHKFFMETHSRRLSKQKIVKTQLLRQRVIEQNNNRKQLVIIIRSTVYFVKENVTLQGATKEVGNLHQLVKLIGSMRQMRNALPASCLSY